MLVTGAGDSGSEGRGTSAGSGQFGVGQSQVGPLPAPIGSAGGVDLTKPSAMRVDMPAGPKAGLAFDMATGRLLWRRGATKVRPIASLTKMMTALLAVERLRPEDRVRVPKAAGEVPCSCLYGLKPGRRVRTEVLLKGLMLVSGNNAAVTLAHGAAGSEGAFVDLMNRRARLLGMTCTRFVDPHGLDVRNRSCARDLATLTTRVMDQPRLRSIVRRRSAKVWPGSGDKVTLRSTNPLMQTAYPGTIGLKTGYTGPAGHCLVAVVQRGGKRVGMVLLGDTDTGADARTLARAAVRSGFLGPA